MLEPTDLSRNYFLSALILFLIVSISFLVVSEFSLDESFDKKKKEK